MRHTRRQTIVTAIAAAALLVPATAWGAGGLDGPVFKLDTAPNGDILAAEASTGILVIDRKDGEVTDTIDLPGVQSVSAIGTRSFWAVTSPGDPAFTGGDNGQALWRVSNGTARMVANLFEVEQSLNPDGGAVDSNPYDVYALGGGAALVVDAGGNSLLRIDNQGTVEVIATFPVELLSTANFNELAGCPPAAPLCAVPAPFIPGEAVPTSVVVGPGGDYWVGELKGFPAPTGQSGVWRIDGDATGVACGVDAACSKALDGFTSIVDLALGPDGRLYVSEFDEASWAAVEIFGNVTGGTLNACDPATGVCEEVAAGVPEHTAVTFGKDGTPWVTIDALVPGGAQVVPFG